MNMRVGLLCSVLFLTACFNGGEKDTLREAPGDGTSFMIQVNLPEDSLRAQIAASVYYDGARQPLVGGDFFKATTDQEEARLYAIENLSGNYNGNLDVTDESAIVTVATVYDSVEAREDRWYPTDELLIDPGANEDLVGYSQDFSIPQPLTNVAITSGDTYSDRSDSVDLIWDAGDGDQLSINSIVTCYDGGEEYQYSVFRVLTSDDNGSASIQLGHIIQSEVALNFWVTLQKEVTTILAYVLLDVFTLGLVDAQDLIDAHEPVNPFDMDHCDVSMTLYREKGEERPAETTGGYAISSTSATIEFTYNPGVI